MRAVIPKQTYLDITHFFGFNQQLLKGAEECGELVRSLCRYNYDKTEDNLENMIEEIADVEIMITQIKEFMQINDEVEIEKIAKIRRTLDYIGAKDE